MTDAATKPRGWYWGWNVVALTLVAQSVSVGVLVYCYALFAVNWIDAFEVGRRDAMLAVSVLQLAGGLLSPFAGRFMVDVPMRRIMISGAALLGLGLILASRASALWQIIVIYALLLPAGNVLCGTLSAQTLVTRWFITRHRGLAIGISAMGTSLGGLAFPQVADALIGDFGWRNAMLVLGVSALLLIIPLAAFVLAREPQRPRTSASVSAPSRPLLDLGSTLRSRAFWLPVLGIVPLNAAFGAVQFNLGAYTRDLGLPTGTAATLISVTSLAMIAGKFAFGTASDRMDHRLLYGVAAAFLIAALLCFQAAPGLPRLLAGAVLLGLATGSVIPLNAVIFTSRFGDQNFSRVMGLAQMFYMTGALGPLLAGWVFDMTGSYDPAFIGLVILTVPIAMAMYFLPPPLPRNPS